MTGGQQRRKPRRRGPRPRPLNGEVIAERRWLLGLTQAQLAKAVGASTQSISDIERGVWGTTLDKARRIAAALDLTLEQIQPQNQNANKDAAA